MRSRVTSRILLNKWQRQKEKDYQHLLEEKEYQRQLEVERYEREQAESHWNCLFCRHWEFRQSQVNRRSIHDQIEYQHNHVDRCLKIEAFMIGLGSELLIKIGSIMKKKMMKKNMFDRKDNGWYL